MSDVIEWEARTKTIKQLIKELQSFENQELVVMVTNDEGKTFNSVKLVSKGDPCRQSRIYKLGRF